MGLTSFYQSFVSKFAEKAKQLTELTKKNIPYDSKAEEQQTFELIEINLVCEPVFKFLILSRKINCTLMCQN